MTLIALTGGIGSGKSTAAAYLASQGALVVDADQITRELQKAGTDAFNEIVARFGTEVVGENGELDRKSLAEIVFADESQRKVLEGIIHPRVKAESERIFNEAQSDDPELLVVYDVPLLRESNRLGNWDAIIVTEAPLELRIDRLVNSRGMSLAEAQARLGAQENDQERRGFADYLVDTSGSLDELHAQLDQIIRSLAKR